jgi:hypothetical protein
MPPQRTPLRSIDANSIKRGPDLTPYQRGRISALYDSGLSPREIELQEKQSRGAVRSTLRLQNINTDGTSQPRSGRPSLYDIRDQRMMLRHMRKYPKSTFKDRRKETGLEMSNSTIKRLARENGLHHWRAKKRPELSDKNAAERLLWCRCRVHWTIEQWGKYMWSDECSVERGRGKLIQWVFGPRANKWNPELVITYKAGKDIRVMVWGAFWAGGRSDLYIMDRDFESAKHGYSARSYLEVLEDQVVKYYQEGLIFMQDNASIHTASVVTEWFANYDIQTTDWPPYSPDLNPIENIWFALKALALKMFPDIMDGSGDSEEQIQKIEECLQVAWKALPDSLFDSLIESMPRRVAACIEAKGWHTKY